MALAIDILCRWPPESFCPLSPTIVCSLFGSWFIKSSDSDSLAASQISSSDASRFPYAIFSNTDPSKRNISWLTNAILLLKLVRSKSFMFILSNFISPSVTS